MKKEPAEALEELIKKRRVNAKKSPYRKMLKSIVCDCPRRKSLEKKRAKFGVCTCDAYSMSYTLAVVISNYLYQYLIDAKHFIVREDWKILEECAKNIREYSSADSWDISSEEKGVKTKFLKKEREFKKSMKYLVDNWDSLWW